MTKKRLREQILRKHGLNAVPPGGNGVKRSRPPSQTKPIKRDPDGKKTLAMLLVERNWGVPLEELLTSGSLSEVAKKLGVSRSTVSYWRKRLGILQEGIGV